MNRVFKSLLAGLVMLALCAAVSTAVQASPALRLLPRDAAQYKRAVVASAHSEFGLNAPIADLAAQLEAESGWRASAASSVGAQGLAEFMPETAAEMARTRPDICAPPNPFSATWAIKCQAAYMADQYKMIVPMPPKMVAAGATYHPHAMAECERWAMAFSAYNGGIGWLQRDRVYTAALGGDPNVWFHSVEFYTKRSYEAYKENRDYPQKIMVTLAAAYVADNWGPSVDCQKF